MLKSFILSGLTFSCHIYDESTSRTQIAFATASVPPADDAGGPSTTGIQVQHNKKSKCRDLGAFKIKANNEEGVGLRNLGERGAITVRLGRTERRM